MAAENGHTALAQLLIEKGANVNTMNDRDQTPLHLAVWEGRKDTSLLLLRHGADPIVINIDDPPPRQCTPLLEWLSQVRQSTSEYFSWGKPSLAQCFSTTEKGARLHDRVLDACLTGQFTTLIGAPLIASTDKADRQLFQDIWEALPAHWQDQNQHIYMQFAKEGGLGPIAGYHAAGQPGHAGRVAKRRGSHEPQVGG